MKFTHRNVNCCEFQKFKNYFIISISKIILVMILKSKMKKDYFRMLLKELMIWV